MRKRLFSSKKKYSKENAAFLCDEVDRLEPLKSEDLVDVLKELVEVVVWGDKHEEAVFDLFLERNMLETFAAMFTDDECPSVARVQVIQCVTILFQNLSKMSSVYVLLSQDRINRMIVADFDRDDEELISNYVSFIKTLSLRLNTDSVQFFFRGKDLPLFNEAVSLLSHDDRMVRTSARSIIMNVFQLDEVGVVAFLEANANGFFENLLTYLRSELATIDHYVTAIGEFPKKSQSASAPSSPTVKETTDDAASPDPQSGDSTATPSRPCEPSERQTTPVSSPTSKQRTHRLPSSLSMLDAAIEDLVDDFYYFNDLCGIPHAAIVQRLREEYLPKFADELLFAAEESKDSLSLPLRLLMAANWIRVNSIPSLHHYLVERSIAGQSSLAVTSLESGDMRCFSTVMNLIVAVGKSRTTSDEQKAMVYQIPKPLAEVPQYRFVAEDEALDGPINAHLERCGEPLPDAVFKSLLLQIENFDLLRVSCLQITLVVATTLPVNPEIAHKNLRIVTTQLQRQLRAVARRSAAFFEDLVKGGSEKDSTPADDDRNSIFLELRKGAPESRELINSNEVLFSLVEHYLPQAAALAKAPVDRIGRDPGSLLPIMPRFSALHRLAGTPSICQGLLVATESEYDTRRKRFLSTIQLPGRAPVSEEEEETVLMLAVLLCRLKLCSTYYRKPDAHLEDGMADFKERFSPKAAVNTTDLAKTCAELTPSGMTVVDGIRCEYSPASSDTLPTPLVGTVMYLYIAGSQVVLVQPDKSVAERGTVVFSMPVFYTEAMVHYKQLFRLTLQQNKPLATMKTTIGHANAGSMTAGDSRLVLKVGIALRDRKICQKAAKALHNHGIQLRERAVKLMQRFLAEELA